MLYVSFDYYLISLIWNVGFRQDARQLRCYSNHHRPWSFFWPLGTHLLHIIPEGMVGPLARGGMDLNILRCSLALSLMSILVILYLEITYRFGSGAVGVGK